MALTRAGGAIGIPGLYVTDDPGAKESNAQKGVLGLRIGLGWAGPNHTASERGSVPCFDTIGNL